MTIAERKAIHSVCPSTKMLLCVFHFLQAKWTKLHDGQNQISNNDCPFLMERTKKLVYAESEIRLLS